MSPFRASRTSSGILNTVLDPIRRLRENRTLPQAAHAEARRDRRDGLGSDPGITPAVDAALAWLGRAQDCSASHDGGVARHFSLIDGWAPSYSETTGYIIPTMLDCGHERADLSLVERARRMLDWLISTQLPGGGFQGGVVGQSPVVPVTFNTGQILMGLASGVTHFGERYRAPMHAAADWLVNSQDADGAWRRHPTPFAEAGEKAYETHVAWGLFEAARVAPDYPYAEAASRNVRWALTKQTANGWFSDCCLTDPVRPLTHTIGYTLRGVIEAYRYTGDDTFLQAALTTANGILGAIRRDGYLPGRLDEHWQGAVDWACLTGSVQIAHCWLLLSQITKDMRFRDAAYAANRYVRSTVRIDGNPDIVGGVKGSFPVSGRYGRFEYLNWACKFFIDANRLEQRLRQGKS